MNNEALNGLILTMTETLKQGKYFVIEQAPEVFKELIRFTIISDLVLIFFSLIGIFCCFKAYRYLKKNDVGDGEIALITVLGGIIFITSAIAIPVNTYEIVLASTAPRVFLIEYTAHLAHGGCSK